MARNTDSNGDFVHPTPVTAWQLIAGVIAVMVTMAMALWTIISDVHQNYTPKSAHDDLISRLAREVSRVDALGLDTMPRREFEAWKKERDIRFEQLEKALEKVQSDHVSRREFDGVVNERGRQIDAVVRDLHALRDQEEQRHTKIQEGLRQPQVPFSYPTMPRAPDATASPPK